MDSVDSAPTARRERRSDGSERLVYAPGPVTLATLADFADRFPRERPPPTWPPTAPGRSSPEEQQRSRPSEEDRAVARLALVERMRRKYPTLPIPAELDAGEIAMVAACSAAVDGDREAKLAAHCEALTGAFAASKDGPPTVRFTWGTLEHFLDHAARGRRELRAEALERQRQKRAALRVPRAPAVPVPAVSPDQMQADLAHIFGAAWKPAGGPAAR